MMKKKKIKKMYCSLIMMMEGGGRGRGRGGGGGGPLKLPEMCVYVRVYAYVCAFWRSSFHRFTMLYFLFRLFIIFFIVFFMSFVYSFFLILFHLPQLPFFPSCYLFPFVFRFYSSFPPPPPPHLPPPPPDK